MKGAGHWGLHPEAPPSCIGGPGSANRPRRTFLMPCAPCRNAGASHEKCPFELHPNHPTDEARSSGARETQGRNFSAICRDSGNPTQTRAIGQAEAPISGIIFAVPAQSFHTLHFRNPEAAAATGAGIKLSVIRHTTGTITDYAPRHGTPSLLCRHARENHTVLSLTQSTGSLLPEPHGGFLATEHIPCHLGRSRSTPSRSIAGIERGEGSFSAPKPHSCTLTRGIGRKCKNL